MRRLRRELHPGRAGSTGEIERAIGQSCQVLSDSKPLFRMLRGENLLPMSSSVQSCDFFQDRVREYLVERLRNRTPKAGKEHRRRRLGLPEPV